MLEFRAWPGPGLLNCPLACPPNAGVEIDSGLSPAAEAFEPVLCRSVFPMTSKYDTGTSPLALGINGLQASYQSSSFSLLMTWKKSPLWNPSSF